ncbi:hypothetical protein SHV42_09370 [Pseudomonas capeferrum]|uniref:hypothetical protein n=1 Tax=Pseudomonas capeferrum TaxID=1495066 RepID=UPI003979E369
MGKKYSHYSDGRVQAGIDSGEFTLEPVGIIRDGNGLIVKHVKGIDAGAIPASIVQVNNNIIFETNLGRYIDLLVKERETVLAGNLAVAYAKVVRKLIRYRDLTDELSELNSASLDVAAEFDVRIDDFMHSVDAFLSDHERNVVTVDRHVNLIFIYVMSGYWRHRSNFKRDSNSKQMLQKIEGQVRHIYEQLLIAELHNKMDLRGSVYAYLFVEKDQDIKQIDVLVKHDSRCETTLDFFESYRNDCLEKKSGYPNDHYSVYRPLMQTGNVQLRLSVALELYKILEKISNLKNLLSELNVAGEIPEADIHHSVDAIDSPFAIFRLGHEIPKPDA